MRIDEILGLLCVVGGMMPQVAGADIDAAEYEVKTAVRSAEERRKLQAEFEVDRKREAERQKQEEEHEARRLAVERAAWEAQPYPVRLTRMRCSVCHGVDLYESQRHNHFGWLLVVLRMEFLDKTRLDAGERSLITAHLAQTYPATGTEALWEGLQQLAVVLLPLGLWVTWKMVRSDLASRKPNETAENRAHRAPARPNEKREGAD